tara:strand:+ start:115 stop:339 length:225 start_codon:yes stop_codon:yes gene_type:complete
MMNDMMPTIEETVTAADLAQIEHEEWERGNEERERWAALEAAHEAKHGMPLLTAAEWEQHTIDQNAWFDEGICK